LETAKGTRLYLPVLLALTTGMRRGEVLGLRWKDVDLKAGTASVNQSLSQIGGKLDFKEPKSDWSRRLVALSAFVVDELVRQKAEQEQQRVLLGEGYADRGLVVSRADGSPFTPAALYQAYTDLVAKAGLPAVSDQARRHSHATHLLKAQETGSPQDRVGEVGPLQHRNHSRHVLTLDSRDAEGSCRPHSGNVRL
jgi:integrase